MISAIQRAKILSDHSLDNNKKESEAKVFLTLRKKVYYQFKSRYTKHYLYHVFKKEELIGLKINRIPCIHDKYKIDELVFNKKSHFNIYYKEIILLTLPFMSSTKYYNKMEQYCVLTNLMLLPKEFPPNLFPSGKKILAIIANRQTLLLHNANRRFEEFKRFYKRRETISCKSPNGKKRTFRSHDSFKEEPFKLADISFSSDMKKKEDFFHFYFKKGVYSSQIDYGGNKKVKTMKEIESLINEIAKYEKTIEINKPNKEIIDKKYNQLISIKTTKSYKQRKSSSKNHTIDKLMMTNISQNPEQYINGTTLTLSSACNNPRSIIMQRNGKRKFKSVEQFVSMSHFIQRKEKEKMTFVNELVTQFNKSKKKKSSKTQCKDKDKGRTKMKRVFVKPISHFNTLTIGNTSRSNRNTTRDKSDRGESSNLTFQTKKLFKTIEVFNNTQKETIISAVNFEKTKKFPMLYAKNIILSQRNQMKRFFLDKKSNY